MGEIKREYSYLSVREKLRDRESQRERMNEIKRGQSYLSVKER